MKFGEVISDAPIVQTTVSDRATPLPPSTGLADRSEHFELEGNVNGKWRMIAVHPTFEKAKADHDDYEEWGRDAVAAWEGFRIIRVIATREILLNTEGSHKNEHN